jgi:hypothetical protein
MTRTGGIALVLLSLATGCVIGARDVEVPGGDDAVVMMLTCAMPEPITHIARHGWLATRKAGDTDWRRFEVGGGGGDPLADHGCGGGGDVRLHAVWRGKRAATAIDCLERASDPYKQSVKYMGWPGPNSNTYVDVMMRRCKLRADLPATAIGKDFRGWIGASWTSGGTGFQIETPLVGVKLGLTEGVEVHILALTIGVDWWPPALILPLGGGRIGFADW